MATEEKGKEEQQPKKKITKTAAIQRYLKRRPDAKPREIVAALAKKGIEVTPATVSTIKNQMKNKGLLGGATATTKAARKTTSRRGRRPGRPKASAAANDTLEMLKQAKSLAETAGGVDKAKKLLDALAELQA